MFYLLSFQFHIGAIMLRGAVDNMTNIKNYEHEGSFLPKKI